MHVFIDTPCPQISNTKLFFGIPLKVVYKFPIRFVSVSAQQCDWIDDPVGLIWWQFFSNF